MKYWLISLLSATILLFLFSCTESLTGNDTDDPNDSTFQDSTLDTNSTDTTDTSTAVPSAPINVSATKGSSSVYIYVTWDPVLLQGVTRYKLLNTTNPEALNNVSEYSKVYEADTSDSVFMSGYYADSIKYQGSQTYYYRVVAYNYYGESEWSELDSGWIDWVDPLDTIPQIFDEPWTLNSDNTGKVSIAWYSEDSTDVYKIYISESDTNNWILLATNPDTPYVDTTNKKTGTTYYYALTKTPLGKVESLKSTPSTYTTKSEGPDSLWATNLSANGFDLSWNPINNATQYLIYVFTDIMSSQYSYIASDTTVKVSGIESGTEVSVVVVGNVSGKLSEHSDTLNVKVLYVGPGQLSATKDQEEFIQLNWKEVLVGLDTLKGATYSLYKGTDTANMTLVDSTLTELSYIDSNVIVDTVYYYKVMAKDSLGHESIFSYHASGKAVKTVIITFEAPDTLWKESGIDTGIVLHWNNALGAASYKLYRKSSYDVSDTWQLIATPTDTMYHDSTTIDRIGYSYAVSTISDSAEESTKYTNTTTFASLGGDYSRIDIDLTADTSIADQITINWNTSSNGTEESYLIYRQENSETMTIVGTVDATVNSWIDTNIVSGDVMMYVVDPIFDIGGVKYKVGVITADPLNTHPYNNAINVTMP